MSAPDMSTKPQTKTPLRAAIEIALIAAVFLTTREGLRSAGIDFPGPIAVFASIIVITIIMAASGGKWSQLGLHAPKKGWDWVKLPVLVIATMAAIVAVAMIVVPAVTSGFIERVEDPGGDSFAFLRGNLPVFLGFMLLVVWGTAAFGEEMMFRGFLQTNLEALFGGGTLAMILAIIAQAILFGLGHSYQGLYGIVLTGAIGLVMGITYWLGGRWLLPVILAHGLVDTISITQIYLGE